MLNNQHRVLLMWIPWNERFLPNTNGQWDFLSKDFLHIMYILTSGERCYIYSNTSLYSWNFLQFWSDWPYGMLTSIKSLKLKDFSVWPFFNIFFFKWKLSLNVHFSLSFWPLSLLFIKVYWIKLVKWNGVLKNVLFGWGFLFTKLCQCTCA